MNSLHIVMYHYVRDFQFSRYPNIKGLDVSLFRQQIDFFKKKFNVVTMEEVIDCILNHHELPDQAILLTFDDGYSDHYTYAFPILEEYGLQGSFFVPGKTFTTHELLDVNKVHYILASTDVNILLEELKKEMNYYRGTEFEFESTDELYNQYAKESRFDVKETIFVKRMLQTVLPERLRNIISSNLFKKYVGITEEQLANELYMTKEQIFTMKRHGMFIGFHGYDHYWLGNLTEKDMKKDIELGLEALDGLVDRNCWVANYPYGSYNHNVVDYIKSRGACIGLTTNVRVANLFNDSALELPRLDCNDFPPKSNNFKQFI